ncbi:hypothetical protein [Sunxiuqinia indica]|jgi:hypothetical protein|uniref:hypothetical protein n=1 Tax=Sunxiuqinia indica TaxID=2692584 RepID=UPI00191664CC|nr:hypothetical protein [Sunxiuqinia indica]
MENKINYQLPDDVAGQAADQINQAINVLKPYLIALNSEERQSLPKMSDGTVPFVEKCLDYCNSDEQFAPPYLDVEGFKNDMDAWEKLMAVLRPVQQLMQNLDDTTTEAGSESYTAALTYYNSVKQAAKLSIPGAKTIYEDLKERFAKRSSSKNGTTV